MFTKLTIHNFFSFEHTEIPLKDLGLVLIDGKNLVGYGCSSNGSGKSSLFEALLWCLYERTVRGFKKDEIIREGCLGGTYVQLDFEGGFVRRSRGHSEYGTGFTINFQDQELSTQFGKLEEYWQVKKLVGLDYTGFLYTMMLGQGTVRFLSEANDADQKRLYEDILVTDSFPHYYKLVGDDLVQEESKRAKFQHELDFAVSEMQKLDESVGKTKLNAIFWDQNKSQKLTELTRKVEESSQRVDSIKSTVKDVEIKKTELFEQIKKLVDLESQVLTGSEEKTKVIREESKKVFEKLLDINKKISEMSDKISKLTSSSNARISLYTGESKKISNARLKLEMSGFKENLRCEHCFSLITVQTFESHLQSLREKETGIQDIIKLEDESLKSQREPLEKEYAELLKSKESLSKERESNSSNIAAAESEFSGKLQEIRSMKGNLQGQLNVVNAQYLQVSQELSSLVCAQQSSKTDLAVLVASVNPYNVEVLLKTLEDLKKKVEDELPKKIAEVQDEIIHLQFLQEMFGDKGLKSYLFDYIVAPLNAKASYYSQLLTDGQLNIQFRTMEQLKSGKLKENFNIVVSNSTGCSRYDGNSGGEKKRANIIILKAAREVLRERSGRNLNLAFYDEFDESMDEQGKELLFQLLELEAEERGSVFVISHDSSWKSRFEEKNRKIITVTKGEDKISRVLMNWS